MEGNEEVHILPPKIDFGKRVCTTLSVCLAPSSPGLSGQRQFFLC